MTTRISARTVMLAVAAVLALGTAAPAAVSIATTHAAISASNNPWGGPVSSPPG
jgi:hypothetical protein